MVPDEEKTQLGSIKIHNKVIASIALLAVLEVDGVSRICHDAKSLLFNFLGRRSVGAIDVKSEKDDSVSITIPIVVKYGYNIPDVALKVQEKVKAAVEEATDLYPKDIIIKIKGVEK